MWVGGVFPSPHFPQPFISGPDFRQSVFRTGPLLTRRVPPGLWCLWCAVCDLRLGFVPRLPRGVSYLRRSRRKARSHTYVDHLMTSGIVSMEYPRAAHLLSGYRRFLACQKY